MKNIEVKAIVFSAILIGIIFMINAVYPVQLEVSPATVQAAPEHTAAGSTLPVAEGRVLEYTLRTVIGQQPAMAYIGVGGEIEGQINPTLYAEVGDTVRLTVINGDPVLHDLVIDEFGVHSPHLTQVEETYMVDFVVDRPGEFTYYCSIPGHREIGMLGKLVVSGEGSGVADAPIMVAHAQAAPMAPAAADAVSVVLNPADMPGPIGDREPTTVRVELATVEVVGQLADGTTFNYFTYNGTVPGPMIRVRAGDTVEVVMHNDASSLYPHSIDLHAVTGPGGGAVATQTLPGDTNSFTFKALNPGVYVYHCATASIPHHISAGMYGLIVVEPAGGLPPVDREFYVMQGEIYTQHAFGTEGHQEFSMDNMRREAADYVVLNGAAGALTSDENAMRANVGETVRIYFGVGGPNYISSFHVIGEIFDRVYPEGAITSAPLTDVQTTLVPSGGATVVEFKLDVPGRYILVDHSLSRLERGLAGFLIVDGPEQPEIFHSEGALDMAGH
jgi:nitrite reductase (NO-forming)